MFGILYLWTTFFRAMLNRSAWNLHKKGNNSTLILWKNLFSRFHLYLWVPHNTWIKMGPARRRSVFIDAKSKSILKNQLAYVSLLHSAGAYPILDTRISGLRPCVTLRVPPLDSETGWTGELWSKTNLLNWQN